MKKIKPRRRRLRINSPLSFGVLCALILLLIGGAAYGLAAGVISPAVRAYQEAHATPTPSPTSSPVVVTPPPETATGCPKTKLFSGRCLLICRRRPCGTCAILQRKQVLTKIQRIDAGFQPAELGNAFLFGHDGILLCMVVYHSTIFGINCMDPYNKIKSVRFGHRRGNNVRRILGSC